MRARVTILMAAFNGERYIGQQIESVLDQTFAPSKILINIDPSDDRTLSIVQRCSNKNPEIQILNANKRFGSAAANFISLISSVDLKYMDYIALSDQDDIWKSDKLGKAIQKLEQGFDAYSSNVQAFWEGGQKKNNKKKSTATKI